MLKWRRIKPWSATPALNHEGVVHCVGVPKEPGPSPFQRTELRSVIHLPLVGPYAMSGQKLSLWAALNVEKVDVRQSRSCGSDAASCREASVFRDLHGAYAISGNPRCIGGGGRRSRFVNPSHRDLVALAITGDEFSSNIAFNGTDDRRPSRILDFEPGPGAELPHPKND